MTLPSAIAAARLEVARDVAALVHAGVDRQRLVTAVLQRLALAGKASHQVEHAAGEPRLHETVKGAAQRVVVRRFAQSDVRQPGGRVAQQRFDAAEAFALVLAQHQAGEQLGGGVILSAKAAGEGSKHLLCEFMGQRKHLPWRLAGNHPSVSTGFRQNARLVKFQG
jgi:hypothetical protein